MTKDEVKLLCETNPRLQWWAMVLFAEIVAVAQGGHWDDDRILAITVRNKVDEFPRLVVHENIQDAKKQVAEEPAFEGV